MDADWTINFQESQLCASDCHGNEMMKFLKAQLLVAALTSAPTLKEQVEKIFLVTYQTGDATQSVIADANSLKADTGRGVLAVNLSPIDVTPLEAAHHGSLLPFIDNSKIPAAKVGFTGPRIQKMNPNHAPPTPSADGIGAFRTVCQFSHMNYDDAIVYPGQKGASHLHAYFGNTGADYASTRESIEKTGNSTCSGGTANRTGYWVPAIIDTKDGAPVKPDKMMIYYKTSYRVVSNNVSPFPAGLRMVAGNMRSTGPQEGVGWKCYNQTVDTYSKTIPASCPVGATLEATIGFPICWDGKNLDSPNHKSHMSEPVQLQSAPYTWSCPATHPVLMPSMEQKVQYVVTEAGASARWRLSSDNYGTEKAGGYSLHADWFNGWDMAIQEAFIKNCLQASMDCHAFLLGDGREMLY